MTSPLKGIVVKEESLDAPPHATETMAYPKYCWGGV